MDRATYLAGFGIILAGWVLRFLWLDCLPVVHGDEAYLAVQIAHWVRGEAFTLRTPSGMFLSPLLIVSHGLMLRLFEPDLLLMRLPGAVWACAGLVLFALLHRRTFGSWADALTGAVVLGSMPLHVATSRCHWDASYMPIMSALVLFPAIRVVDGRWTRTDLLLLAAGAFLCLWTHLSSIVFLGLLGLAAAWVQRRRILEYLETWPAVALARPSLQVAGMVVLALMGAAGLLALSGRDAAATLIRIESGVVRLLVHPGEMAAYLWTIAEFVGGQRAFKNFAGVSDSALLSWTSVAAALLVVAAVLGLARGERQSDRFLAAIWLGMPLVWIATASVFELKKLGNERYVLWILPLAAVSLVRGWNVWFERWRFVNRAIKPIWLALSALWLVTFWFHYFVPLQARAVREGGELAEQNAVAAGLVADAAGEGQSYRIYSQDWSIGQPLKYLLEPRAEIRMGLEEAQLEDGKSAFVVGYADSGYLKEMRRKLEAAQQPFIEQTIVAQAGNRLVTVFLPKR